MARPKGAVLQARDFDILEAIYSHDQNLTDYQLQKLFFGSTLRTAEIRLEKLRDLGYVSFVRHQEAPAVSYRIVYLTKKGGTEVADRQRLSLTDLKLRELDDRISLRTHDVKVNDFRLAVETRPHPDLTLLEWIPSGVFWADYDTISYEIKHNGKVKKERRGVRPDSYFVVEQRGFPPSRFLLEIDLSTEPHPRLIRDKLHAGVAYIKSPIYKERFGYNAGRWLMVFRSELRMKRVQAAAGRELGRAAGTWYFTTFERYSQAIFRESGGVRKSREYAVSYKSDLLVDPIWFQGTEETPTSLFESLLRKGT